MRRRIQKSKRHKKLKSVDPFYIGDRVELLDKKVKLANSKPEDPDHQEIPRRLKELMEIQHLVKTKKFKRKKVKQNMEKVKFSGDYFGADERGMDRPLSHVPSFQKKRGETDQKFMYRVQKETHNFVSRKHEEVKFGIEIQEKAGGAIEIKKQSVNYDMPSKLYGEIKKTSEKAAKRKQKEKLKKDKKAEKNIDEFAVFKDEVKFGEVVTRPPTFDIKSGAATKINHAKPGKRTLLLKNLLASEISQSILMPRQEITTVDRTVKRKYLSASERRKLDSERNKAVAAYRLAKASKTIKKHKETRRNQKEDGKTDGVEDA